MSVTRIPITLKEAVVARDGLNCLKCGVLTTGESWGPRGLHIDHIVPEARGGLTMLENLQVLCRTCNLTKGTLVVDYRKTWSLVSRARYLADLRTFFRRWATPDHEITKVTTVYRSRCSCGWKSRPARVMRRYALAVEHLGTHQPTITFACQMVAEVNKISERRVSDVHPTALVHATWISLRRQPPSVSKNAEITPQRWAEINRLMAAEIDRQKVAA